MGKKKEEKISYNMGKVTSFILSLDFFFLRCFEEPYPSVSAYHNVKLPSFKKSLNFKIPLCIKNLRTLGIHNSMVYFNSIRNNSDTSKSS